MKDFTTEPLAGRSILSAKHRQDEVEIVILHPRDNCKSCRYLDEREARALFNWLGVFLHRKGPG